ncbi:2OG-Fe(II) oxygenase [Pontixanthobacter aestiaquae]|uniref:2OG-Fe(II) oxygenase n=1 Tax=Pontixanthobacter aestiaquae TaxID=1509367 RepID=A0A844Z8E1_9SPHN|nr:2OG-Fe(II) oxygenase [Pontixanthobacter aestiaquae]MDN3645793.1 2OG-Fe(II) oxygenase [Pontixanthobacter aestiaquae]MXO83213.1 2OG-Fe(II) oxygenase [Pontixanthobacter aestiaquae]
MAKTSISPDKDALKRVGDSVRKRLDANPAAERLDTGDKADMYAVSHFLKGAECQKLLGMVDAIAKPSELFDQDYSTGFRTSFSGNLNPHEPFMAELNARIDTLLGLKPQLGEAIQGQRYHVGQQFKPHNDFFYPDQEYWKIERKRGGQRSWTAMAFLNPVERGGATHFVNLDLRIKPQPGVLLIWNNADREGLPNENMLHAGTPVEAGVKYVLTKWYRTRPLNHKAAAKLS